MVNGYGYSGKKINFHSVGEYNQDGYAPPPYTGAMKAVLASGLHVGDPAADELGRSALISTIHSDSPEQFGDSADELPTWDDLDWESVRRGQKLFSDHQSYAHLGLGGILLVGFCIRRNADVLLQSGYATSPLVAYQRYMHTGFYLIDWFTTDLTDAASLGRQSLRKVRAMHALGRLKCIETEMFDDKEGVPVSQSDLAQTQLAFTGVWFEWVQHVRGVFGEQDLEDMVAVFRVVGHFLGIKDECNVCSSLARNRECYHDLESWLPAMVATEGKGSRELRNAVALGLGQNQAAGVQFWGAICHSNIDVHLALGASYECFAKSNVISPDAGAVWAMHCIISHLKYTNRGLSFVLRRQRKKYLEDRPFFEGIARRQRILSRFSTKALWPAVSVLYSLQWKLIICVVLMAFVYVGLQMPDVRSDVPGQL